MEKWSKLQELIKRKNWTNKTAAQKLEITERTLYEWLKRTKRPTWANVVKISEVFEIPLAEIN